MGTKTNWGSSDRGAILVHVAFGLIALTAFTTFVVDYGVLWASRRQAQNAADASALAGAVALAYDNYDDRSDTGPAKTNAYALSQRHFVWGQPPSVVVATDITFPTCPDGTDACIRVDVYRNQARANPLPIFFGQIVGLTAQGVRATATAEAATANASDCLKPWAVVDKWAEHWPTTADWTVDSRFDKYNNQGDPDPAITTPDVYVAPTETDFGTGFHPYDADHNFTSDYGLQLWLKVGTQQDFDFAAGWFSALALDPDCPGGDCYRDAIKGCIGITYKIGDQLPINTEPGQKVGPTRQAVQTDADSLVNQDPGAHWDPAMNGGLGGVAGSAFKISPRIVAIPLVNPDTMAAANKNGRTSVPIANILGFFVEGFDSKGVVGRLMTMPGLKATGGPNVGGSFLKVIFLVR